MLVQEVYSDCFISWFPLFGQLPACLPTDCCTENNATEPQQYACKYLENKPEIYQAIYFTVIHLRS